MKLRKRLLELAKKYYCYNDYVAMDIQIADVFIEDSILNVQCMHKAYSGYSGSTDSYNTTQLRNLQMRNSEFVRNNHHRQPTDTHNRHIGDNLSSWLSSQANRSSMENDPTEITIEEPEINPIDFIYLNSDDYEELSGSMDDMGIGHDLSRDNWAKCMTLNAKQCKTLQRATRRGMYPLERGLVIKSNV